METMTYPTQRLKSVNPNNPKYWQGQLLSAGGTPDKAEVVHPVPRAISLNYPPQRAISHASPCSRTLAETLVPTNWFSGVYSCNGTVNSTHSE